MSFLKLVEYALIAIAVPLLVRRERDLTIAIGGVAAAFGQLLIQTDDCVREARLRGLKVFVYKISDAS